MQRYLSEMITARAARESAAVYAFGRYETLFRVGAGGMAEVFAARLRGEAGFERLVAIKRLLPHLADDRRHVARFLDEARLAARVVHPHVVQTLDLGRTDEGEPFLVLELVIGSSLDRLLGAQHRLPLPVLLTWLAQAAEGLHAAHVARAPDGAPLGLVHRDVSPHNILVGVDGDARIGDFGVAQAALLGSARAPADQLHGKLAYFSPEQALGRTLDARSDVFSLGVVAWEAVTGRPLFQADHPATVLDRVRTLNIPPPCRLVSGLSVQVSDVIMAALAREPEARTRSAQAFARALATAAATLGEVPGASVRARHVYAAYDPVWQELCVVSQLSATLPVRRRRRPLWSVLGAAAAVSATLAMAGLTPWLHGTSRDVSAERAPLTAAAARSPGTTSSATAQRAPQVSAWPGEQTAPVRAQRRGKRRTVQTGLMPAAAPADAPAALPAAAPAAPHVGGWGGRS